jgi:hypothetical protein
LSFASAPELRHSKPVGADRIPVAIDKSTAWLAVFLHPTCDLPQKTGHLAGGIVIERSTVALNLDCEFHCLFS